MVNWTADKDQIILKGIFEFHDIKSSAPLLKYLADEIGGDCTPKAVSHRLINIRKGGATTVLPASATSTPAKAAKPKTTTSRSRAKATPKSKKPASSDDEVPLDDEELLSPSAARGKRTAAKRSYIESDMDDDQEDQEDGYIPMGKRVKTEPVDEQVSFEEEVDDEV